MRLANAQIAIEGGRGLFPERRRSEAPTLAEHGRNFQVEVDVGDLQTGHLPEPNPRIEKQADDGLVPPLVETLTASSVDERAELIVGEDRYGWLLQGRRFDPVHWVDRNLPFLVQPFEQLFETGVTVRAVALARVATIFTRKARIWSVLILSALAGRPCSSRNAINCVAATS